MTRCLPALGQGLQLPAPRLVDRNHPCEPTRPPSAERAQFLDQLQRKTVADPDAAGDDEDQNQQPQDPDPGG
jgi:hypothetical protein